MYSHSDVTAKQLKELVRSGEIQFAGNRKLRIYGTLHCGSGKRMKVETRVFFRNAEEAVAMGYRPCGNCMRRSASAKPII